MAVALLPFKSLSCSCLINCEFGICILRSPFQMEMSPGQGDQVRDLQYPWHTHTPHTTNILMLILHPKVMLTPCPGIPKAAQPTACPNMGFYRPRHVGRGSRGCPSTHTLVPSNIHQCCSITNSPKEKLFPQAAPEQDSVPTNGAETRQ